jgi:hypothetical protein
MKRSFIIRIGKWPFFLGTAAAVVLIGLRADLTFHGRPFEMTIMGPRGRMQQVMGGRSGTGVMPGVGASSQGKAVNRQQGLAAMRAFRLWMGSLRSDIQGIRLYDSIVKARPGLLDSVQAAYDYYENQ